MTGRTRRLRRVLILLGTTGLFVGLLFASGAFAVHDLGLFELDGDAVTGAHTGLPDDWDRVFAGTDNADASLFLTDPFSPSVDDFFTGGGSKDNNCIQKPCGASANSTNAGPWAWKASSAGVQPKDDLEHAYMAVYHPTTGSAAGHEVVYLGADRYSNNGSAQIGFWLSKSKVGESGTFPACHVSCPFTGEHTVGDLLVVTDFVGNSSDKVTFTIYEWVGTGGSDGPLDAIFGTGSAGAPADCSLVPAGDAVCGLDNTGGQIAPWSYNFQGAPSSTFPERTFFEGGIDLTAVLGKAPGCFSSFLAETRSSHKPDSTNSDFVSGDIDVCHVKVEKSGPALSKIGDTATYTYTITNDGGAPLTLKSTGGVVDDKVGDLTADAVAAGCTNLAAGASCTFTKDFVIPAGAPDPFVNTVTVHYLDSADVEHSADYSATASHSTNLIQPSVTAAKDCSPVSKIGDEVGCTVTINNTSSSDTPDLQLDSISDTVQGDLTDAANFDTSDCGATLASGASCTITYLYLVPDTATDPFPNTVTVHYHPAGFTNDITAEASDSVNLFQPSVTVDKACADLSKIGDRVDCTVTVTNTSSSDTPDLQLDSISDTVQGDLTNANNVDTSDCGATLASGASCTITYHFNVPAGATEPFTNTVTVHYHPDGFTNDITANDTETIELFQPSVTVDKACTDLSKIGDRVDCTVTVTNTSSSDTPDLQLDSISDTVQGDLTNANNVDTSDCGATLASGASCTITYHFNVPAGATEPFTNTVTVHYHPDGFTNDITANDTETIELFQPSVTVDKACTDLSKIGDRVDCTVTVTNTSSSDTPDLQLDSISDTVQGDLTNAANFDASTCGATLASGASCTITYHFNVPAGATEPFTNTVTVHYHPDGFTNDITANDTETIELFQPSVTVDKSCDDLSKIGDEVGCTVTINNTSSSDTPDLQLDSISDTVQGDLTDAANFDTSDCGATLASGASCTITYLYLVPDTATDPFPNTVTVHYHPAGFTNDITAEASDSVNLFQPSVTVDKACADLSKIGDRVDCTVTVTNTSSSDTPDLQLDSISDTVQGDLTNANNVDTSDCGATLASGASCTITYHFNVPAGATEPFTNTVTVHYHPDGFTNDITANDTETIELFQPSVTVDKSCDDLSKIGDEVGCTVTINNTSSSDTPDLQLDSISDTVQGDLTNANNVDTSDCGATLASGASCTITYHFNVPAGATEPFTNTVTVHYHPAGFTNDITANDTETIELFQPSVTVDKACTDLSKIGDRVDCTVTVTNTSSSDTPDLQLDSISDTVQGDLTNAANFDASTCGATLASGASCTITYHFNVPAGATEPFTNTVTVHYHPDGFTNDITANDTETIELFQPSVTVDKSCDDLSKIGDEVGCTVTINNTSSTDTPDLQLDSISDTVQGDLTDAANFDTSDCGATLASGASCTITYLYLVPDTATDPFPNTVTVHYHPAGFTNDITAEASDSVNLFQPSVTVDKACADLSKIGDRVDCTVTVTNTSSSDTPDLQLDSISDTVQGDLTNANNVDTSDCGATLASGASCTITYHFNVPAGATEPFTNTVTVHYHPDGFTNDITANDTETIELFQPSVTVDKACDDLSKIGDRVDCTVTVTNTSSSDTPDLQLDSISDTVQGDLTNANNVDTSDCGATLASGASCTITYHFNVPAGATEPFTNTVTVHYHPDGFTNDITANDTETIELFQPSVTVDKACTDLSKIGDRVDCTVTVTNTSSSDTPDLQLDSISDTVQGDLTNANNVDTSDCGATLASGASCTITYHFNVPAGATEPFTNTVTVHYHPDGFTNDITANDTETIELFQPSVTVAKTCAPSQVNVGETITFNCTITNTSSTDTPNLQLDSVSDSLVGDITSKAISAGCDNLAPGASCVVTYTYTTQASDPDTITNTVTVHYHPAGFQNDISASASCSVTVHHDKQGIFPTQTTCAAFAGGSPSTLAEVTYGLRNNDGILNTSPGVFFYYASFTVSSSQPSLAVDAQQFFSQGANGALDTTAPSTDWVVQQGQAFLYRFQNGGCVKLTSQIAGAPSNVEIIYAPAGGVQPGTYVLGIKYTNSPSLIGQPPCHGTGPSCRYYFAPSRGTTAVDDALQPGRATSFLFRQR